MQFATLKTKVGVLRNQVLEHISGVYYGVHSVPARAAVFESCQRLVILKGMPVTFIVTLTVAFIRSKENIVR